MFLKNKRTRDSTRHYSGRRLVVDQLDAKVVKTGTLEFNAISTDAPPGVELYVSQTGSDSNDGSESSPFATLTRAFERLTQISWDGGAQIYIDGAVPVTGSNFNTPLEPAAGVSGVPYEISVKGLNVAAEGIFTVTGNGSWGPGSVTRTDFDEITLDSAPTTASQGKMVHFKSGNLSGLRIPIYGVSGSTLQLIVPVGSVFQGDTLEIETHGDSLELSGGEIEFASLSRLPLCIRNLDINTNGGYFTSNDYAGTIQLLGVKVTTELNSFAFQTNLFAEGVWLTGTGALMDGLSRNCVLAYTFMNMGSAIRYTDEGVVTDYYTSIVSESTEGIRCYTGSFKINRVGLNASPLRMYSGCTAYVSTLSADGGEVSLDGGRAVIVDVEVMNNVNGVDVNAGYLTLGGSINLHDNGAHGLSMGKSKVIADADVDGSGNGTAGILVESGSQMTLPGGSTISGPLGPATDCYSLNGALGAANNSASDPSDFAQIGFY